MSSLWAWDLQKLVTGHAPHPLANGPSWHIYSSRLATFTFLISTHQMQAKLGTPGHLVVCGGSLGLGWENDSLRSNYCFPGRMRREYRDVGHMCDSLGS